VRKVNSIIKTSRTKPTRDSTNCFKIMIADIVKIILQTNCTIQQLQQERPHGFRTKKTIKIVCNLEKVERHGTLCS
jgi:hypothetical protein